MAYKTHQVAKITGVTIQTIYNWLRKGKVPEPERDYNEHRIFTNEDLKIILDYKNRTSSTKNIRS